MPYELFLALRYLRMRRGRRVVKWTALAAVVGIACGVAALVVALALANGFRDGLREKILRGTAHVTLLRDDGRAGDDMRAVAERVRAVEGVVDAAPTTYEGALLSGPGGAGYAVMRGMDGGSARTLAEIRRTLANGSVEDLFRPAPPPAVEREAGKASAEGVGKEKKQPGVFDEGEGPAAHVLVGEELAKRTGLMRVGEEGWVLTGEKSPTPPGFSPRARRVRVAGVFSTGLYDYDASWLYVSLEEAEALGGGLVPRSSAISIKVGDIYAAGEVAARLRRALGDGWATVDWREANRPLFAALELERRTVAVIILLIMLVASLNITTTLVLVVVERRADIAVLNALGARGRSVVAIFMIEGALLGAAGALLGVTLGLAACYLGNRFELVSLPPDVYSLSSVTLSPSARDVLLPALAAFAVSLLATVYPARQAARVRPAEALRYE